ncbi:hotdog domain-containing protein [Gordonia sp. OPL2]|uniref:hotdog domain-containing protein n=1 Tax=Gordonia sp. OPL2 TaxID=2486274 RepID=UPI0021CCD414|nr:hotdog domain-containing protein [Gordonia sp. OPL2]
MMEDSTQMERAALHDPVTAFGIGNVLAPRPGVVTAEQQLGPRFTDHRGRIDMPALAVLFDHLGGLPFFRSGPHGSPCVQARLSMSMQGHVAVGDVVTGTAELLMHDDGFGTTRVDITTSTGTLCSSGSARNVAVGRTFANDPSTGRGVGLASEHSGGAPVELPAAIEPSLSGRQIVEQIAIGVRSAGPLTELLNGVVEPVTHGRTVGIRFTATTEPWMGNVFGTMHGGVIAAITAAACSFAGQANAAAGIDYQLGDLAIGFLRSPAVQGDNVIVDVVPIKVGRRIASFDATMTAHDGMLLSRATADVLYR